MAIGLYDHTGYMVYSDAHDLPVIHVENRHHRPLSIVSAQCWMDTDGIALAYDEPSEGAHYAPQEERTAA